MTDPVYIPITIEAELSDDECTLEAELHLDECVLETEFETFIQVVRLSGDLYDGPTEVDPSFELQVLKTTNKTLESDISVNPIQVSRTTNLSGGTTIYIGGIISG